MTSWRTAEAIKTLFDEVNRRWPNRDKASDGTIGNAEHAARTSDHNPWIRDRKGVGVVRAGDVDSGPGLNPDEAHDDIGDTVAEAARQAGLHGHPAMGTGSYVIWDHHIASAVSVPPWSWRPYVGDPHTSHPHISVGLDQAGYDSTRPWGIWPVPSLKPTPSRRHGKPPTLRRRGKKRPEWTRRLQKALHIPVDGVYGPSTAATVKAYRRRHKLWPATGTAGPRVWKSLGIR